MDDLPTSRIKGKSGQESGLTLFEWGPRSGGRKTFEAWPGILYEMSEPTRATSDSASRSRPSAGT